MNDISYISASGADVGRIIEKIEFATAGESMQTIMMACMAVIVLAQNPDIDSKKLVAAIKGASEWLACFLAEDSGEIATC